MKRLLPTILGISCFAMANLAFSSGMPVGMPGSPCVGIDGKVCNSGTQNCVCQKNQIGKWCRDVNGVRCHRGTRGCICKY
ncbi:hypothetical protein [Legionella gresilensis]|uniref:hypothetical protein n=1 Tax=Legionella gresilensis TaxID=91823 RepID=UPI0010415185|nr:hypothetical protein [Legionella gresilensis]